MDVADQTYCPRHPRTETRLTCVQCGEPICPQCMVDAPVGHKCPACARQAPGARRQGRTDQYVRAALYGGGAMLAGGVLLAAVFRSVGFFTWILAGVAGYGIAEAVRRGAQGNRADPFRYLAFGFAVGAVALGWLIAVGGSPADAVRVVTAYPLRLVTFLAAAYGAWRSVG
jgi:hypothetical protein